MDDPEITKLKNDYFAAKLGLIYLCVSCRTEIYLHVKTQSCWLHKNNTSYCCWNDPSDGTAWPMNEFDLRDYYEEIERIENPYGDSSPY